MASDSAKKTNKQKLLRGLFILVLAIAGVLLWAAVLTPIIKGPKPRAEEPWVVQHENLHQHSPPSLQADKAIHTSAKAIHTPAQHREMTDLQKAQHAENAEKRSRLQAETAEKTRLAADLVSITSSEQKARTKVAKLKASGMVMESNPTALTAIAALQQVTRKLIKARYGAYLRKTAAGTVAHISMKLKFPATMHTSKHGSTDVIMVETAPIELMPHAVFLFLEIVQHWKGGHFMRNAGHVVQAAPSGSHLGLAFQEYSSKFPHVKGTMGYAGRPGGPQFYFSTVDNTRNHGPGSQNSKTEADSCFAKIIDGLDAFDRLAHEWGMKPNQRGSMGFLSDPKEFATFDLTLIPLVQDTFED